MFAVGTVSGFPLFFQPYGNDVGGHLITATTFDGCSSWFSPQSPYGCMCSLRSSSARKNLSLWSTRSVVVSCSGGKAGGGRREEGIQKECKSVAVLEEGNWEETKPMVDSLRSIKRSADWKAARAYKDSGVIYEGRIEGFNSGGLLVRFYSLVGFLPYPQLSPSHSCKGLHHLTGLVHISEVSWDLVQDVRDLVSEGDEVRVKVIHIDKERARINLSIKQLEDDPFLVTLDKVIAKGDTSRHEISESTEEMNMEPFLELKNICQELLKEDGITDVQIGRQGFEKRVVSQDLELWLSNKPASDGQFTLLARGGRQVQEIQLKTSLDLEDIRKAVQRASGRVQ
ncbi:unnamed protein product [Victoria cruziana]